MICIKQSDFEEPRLSIYKGPYNLMSRILTLAYCRLQNRVSKRPEAWPPDEPWLSERHSLRWKDGFCQRRNRRDCRPMENHRAALANSCLSRISKLG
jgi:hypothetical protein